MIFMKTAIRKIEDLEHKTGSFAALEVKACKCGGLWTLRKTTTNGAEHTSGSIKCSCGSELVSWSGYYVYTVEKVGGGSAPAPGLPLRSAGLFKSSRTPLPLD
jgi:hypothetical protein